MAAEITDQARLLGRRARPTSSTRSRRLSRTHGKPVLLSAITISIADGSAMICTMEGKSSRCNGLDDKLDNVRWAWCC